LGGFLGSYRHSLDAKGRVSLPAPFRHGSASEAFVLIRVHDDALTLYPEEAWKERASQLQEMLKRRPDYRHQLLRLTGSAHRIVPDGQGRILIPDRLRQEAHLENEVLIVGALDKIEIWNPEWFEQRTTGGAKEFDDFAASIFA
jgi:MraZ protein